MKPPAGQVPYDRLGVGYARTRREDPAIAARIDAALGDARTVVNVGAGAGSYEPADREVVAVEPSAEMIAQRAPEAAPAIQASAEALPFEEDRFDAAMAVLTVHHWPDRDAGLREMARVARRRLVLVSFEPAALHDLWIVRDYFPAIAGLHANRVSTVEMVAGLPGTSVASLPVPRECTDLFFAALWARPQMLLDDEIVGPMWVWDRLSPEQRAEGRARLAADLESGTWEQRNGHLRELDELDVGLRLVVSELNG